MRDIFGRVFAPGHLIVYSTRQSSTQSTKAAVVERVNTKDDTRWDYEKRQSVPIVKYSLTIREVVNPGAQWMSSNLDGSVPVALKRRTATLQNIDSAVIIGDAPMHLRNIALEPEGPR